MKIIGPMCLVVVGAWGCRPSATLPLGGTDGAIDSPGTDTQVDDRSTTDRASVDVPAADRADAPGIVDAGSIIDSSGGDVGGSDIVAIDTPIITEDRPADASTGCVPRSSSCASVTTRRVCAADGSGFTDSPCAAYHDCVAGECIQWTDVYAAFPGPVPWEAARLDCTMRGGTIASVESAAENAAASTACEAVPGGPGPDTGCWLGSLAPFTSWQNGRAVSFTNWASGQPSREIGANAMWIYNARSATSRANAGRWDDQTGLNTASYLCRLSDPTRTAGAAAIVRTR